MNKKFLESSEFYSIRFNNFSTLIIVPVTLILLFLIVLSFFAKREITVTGAGSIEPKGKVAIIQSSVRDPIVNSYLKDGKYVHKGDTLLTYNNNNNQIKTKYYKEQKKVLKNQLNYLALVQDGIQQNKDTFQKDDIFGYHSLLKNYLAQQKALSVESQMEYQEATFTMDQQNKLSASLQESIDRTSKEIQQYQTLYEAIQNNHLYSEKKYQYIYKSYQTALKTSTNTEEIKEEYLNNINQQIEALQESLENSTSQSLSIKSFDSSNYKSDISKEKLTSQKNEALEKIFQSKTETQQKLQEINTNISNLKDITKKYTLKAPKTGVLNFNETYTGTKYINPGTVIAQIYPVIKKEKYIQFKSYIQTSDISSVKKNQRIRFKITRNVPKPIIITGTIENISVSPVNFNKKSLYLVTSNAKIPERYKKSLRYGMSGTTSIVTGETTFFNYYKSKLLNKE